jgi:hypothetical protein
MWAYLLCMEQQLSCQQGFQHYQPRPKEELNIYTRWSCSISASARAVVHYAATSPTTTRGRPWGISGQRAWSLGQGISAPLQAQEMQPQLNPILWFLCGKARCRIFSGVKRMFRFSWTMGEETLETILLDQDSIIAVSSKWPRQGMKHPQHQISPLM